MHIPGNNPPFCDICSEPVDFTEPKVKIQKQISMIFCYPLNFTKWPQKPDFCAIFSKIFKLLKFYQNNPTGVFYARNRLSALPNIENTSLAMN
jgi:hypothetical protein